jgi:hypothetical protein
VNPPPPANHVSTIADLLAWARRISDAGRHADPAERVAYQAAKTDLLAHLTAQPHDLDQASTKDIR